MPLQVKLDTFADHLHSLFPVCVTALERLARITLGLLKLIEGGMATSWITLVGTATSLTISLVTSCFMFVIIIGVGGFTGGFTSETSQVGQVLFTIGHPAGSWQIHSGVPLETLGVPKISITKKIYRNIFIAFID